MKAMTVDIGSIYVNAFKCPETNDFIPPFCESILFGFENSNLIRDFDASLIESIAGSIAKEVIVADINRIKSREGLFIVEIIAVNMFCSIGKHAIVQEINVSNSGIGIIFRK